MGIIHGDDADLLSTLPALTSRPHTSMQLHSGSDTTVHHYRSTRLCLPSVVTFPEPQSGRVRGYNGSQIWDQIIGCLIIGQTQILLKKK